ncbi:nitrogen regulation protein NR(II) [Ferrimonas marina]|uniref:Sensory histidine kinase/phosphatase NtrB n=1 Tax=Ferrimonas marina TaxID=299255 RepID=A0A1M5ZAV8_9GAMM|nr:nitrogen regulation protein NR(II) [Ferrimonas marina]SHI21278.1 two-component system, NtrC family, nitrogen regulation sensor histidine kinase GlnL [Ferrimonas marina]
MVQANEPSLLDHLNTAVLVLDPQQRVTYCNLAAEQLLGLSSRRMMGCVFAELYSQIATDPATLAQALDGHSNQALHALSLVTLDNQHHTVDLTVTPLEQGQRLLEARTVDQQLRISQELQQYAQHHAAQLLVRGLAHEIKNPLGGLRGAAQLLNMELESQELKEFTGIIIEQADRLRNLVDRLLGPQHPGQWSLNNVHRLLEQTSTLCELESNGQVEVERDYDPSIPDFLMDHEQLQQALLNIMRNALQAMNNRGKLVLRTRSQGATTIAGVRHRQVVAISIIDNGPGIPGDVRDTLFYPMVTSKAEGSGLGLSIAQNIVSQHQGRIDLESWPGHTEFTLLLPLIFRKEAP